MKAKTLFNFILTFFVIGLCLVFASYADSSDIITREEIIARTMSTLKAQEDLSRQPEVYVSEKSSEADHRLRPRFEANWRYSNNRSIMMGEFWLPIVQCKEDAVLFCDLRIMGDDSENKEFNIGAGYREVLYDTILGNGVAGAMIWFDRRFTDSDFQFNQITLGGEWLGEQFDLRVNGYVPLDKKNTYTQANPNGEGKGFVGNQILVNTDQLVVEEVLPGLDFEAGTQLNFMNTITDSTRLFMGGYHFEGDLAEDITGVRTRIVSDITSDVQLGVRFQHDDVRGSQTYFESTIRFPFGYKKKYKREGYWSRLDESPERDIDVVSNSAVADTGVGTPLLNASSGIKQNVIHVDNTAAAGGDGSVEKPYNTLATAESAASTNTLIYIHEGDGATTNQNVGITLDDKGQMLVGSGVDLLYSEDRFKTSNGMAISGKIIAATTAPIITNGAGNGIEITADDVFVSGIKVDGTNNNGIYVINANNTIIDNMVNNNNLEAGVRVHADGGSINKITIQNSTSDNNLTYGFLTYALNAGTIDEVLVTENQATNNMRDGFYALSVGANSNIETANFSNNTATSNAHRGFFAYALTDGDIGSVTYTDNVANNNTIDGFRAWANGVGSVFDSVSFINNISNNGSASGFFVEARVNSVIGNVDFKSNTSTSNTDQGFFTQALSAGSITQANFTDNTATGNSDKGFTLESEGVGSTLNAYYENNISNNNTLYGFYAFASTDGVIGQVDYTGNTSDGNNSNGYYMYAVSGSINRNSFVGNVSKNNQGFGIVINDNNATGVLNSDLGGGTFGSTGGNSSYNNTNEELFVDIDGGNLKAENNWWGSTSGLTGAETLLQDASTVDATPFLIVDPN